jgi:energy-coupling factor transport system permease protein
VRRLSFYVPSRSWLHRLHPSTKLVLYVLCFILTYLAPWPLRWLIAALAVVGLWLCGVPPTKYRYILFVTLVATLTVPLLNGLWPVEGDPVIIPIWGDFGFHRDGLITGLAFAGLYTAIGLLTIAVLVTTQTWDLAEAPSMLGIHHSVGFALAYAFRYMPEAATNYLELADVWRTRGVRFAFGYPWERFWLQCRLLAALLILEFSRVRTKSNAVEARGFSLKQRGTYFILGPIPRTDKALMAAVGALTALAALWTLATLFTGRST